MSFEALQERLTALQETTSQLWQLIERLTNLKFQPGSVPINADEESSVSGELSSEISQILREEEDELDLLQEEVEDLRSGRPGSDADHNKTRLKDGLERLRKDLSSCRISFRRAQLSAKRNLAQAQRLEREILIQSYTQPPSEETSPVHVSEKAPELPVPATRHLQKHQHSALSEEDQQTVGASSNVTSALRRAHELVTAELARSEFAHQTLTESTTALAQLNESYSSLDTMLASSRDLLGTLLKSQKSDTWYLQTSIYILLATGAWLLYRRIFYVLVWWVLWLPFKLLFACTMSAGRAVGIFGKPGATGVSVGEEPNAQVVWEGEGMSVPTAQVGQETKLPDASGDPDSIVEKVGRIIDGNADTVDIEERADEGADRENEAARQKDEL